jgi:hypothetical protein
VVPAAGRWSRVGDALRFTPRFPFPRGRSYVLVRTTDDAGSGDPRWAEVARLDRAAAETVPTATVVEIHPTAAVVPENLLRLSVTFSAGMDEGSAAGRVHLEDEAGRPVAQALLPMPPELWDRPRRRLTLLLEPGRIKRGLVPNVELGAPLARTASVALVVDSGVRDADGTGLVAGARRRYRVGPAVRLRVAPERWQVRWPAAGSPDPLVVDFERPLDHVLALRCLRLTTAGGAAVAGRVSLDDGQVRWCFTPLAPWPAGPWQLHVDTTLEDLAGNSVRRVFDRDLARPQDDPLDAAEVVLSSAAVSRDGGGREGPATAPLRAAAGPSRPAAPGWCPRRSG